MVFFASGQLQLVLFPFGQKVSYEASLHMYDFVCVFGGGDFVFFL